MALLQPPSFIQARSDHKAQHDRLAIGGLITASGVRAVGQLKVTAQASPNMTVQVSQGGAYIIGTESTHQGVYHVYQDTNTASLSIGASSPTLARKDIVVAQVRDAAYSGANNDWIIAVVAGTPAASPAEPATPANGYKLATIDIAANATSITNANITDRTTLVRTANSGTTICTSSTRPAAPFTGMEIFETNTLRTWRWTGTVWRFGGGPRTGFAGDPQDISAGAIAQNTGVNAWAGANFTIPAGELWVVKATFTGMCVFTPAGNAAADITIRMGSVIIGEGRIHSRGGGVGFFSVSGENDVPAGTHIPNLRFQTDVTQTPTVTPVNMVGRFWL